MSEKRFYVGNINPTVTDSDILNLFQKFGEVRKTQILTKGDKTFAFVDIQLSASTVPSLIKRLTGSIWKGREISVQVAKESYMERLARERQESQQLDQKMMQTPESKRLQHFVQKEPQQPKLNVSQRPEHFEERQSLPVDKRTRKPQIADEPIKTSKIPVDASRLKNITKEYSKPHEDLMQTNEAPVEQHGKKRILDNEKRLQSLQEKQDDLTHHQQIISAALKSEHALNKKIKFAHDSSNNRSDKSTKKALFDGEEGEDLEDLKLTNGRAMNESKHEKLVNLQSKFASDPRFQVNQKFVEDDASDDDETHAGSGEVQKYLNILEEVLGKPILKKPKQVVEKDVKKPFIIPRFDPTKPDAEKYELKKPEKPAKKINAETSVAESKSDAPPVDKDRYYEYSNTLKDLFTTNSEESAEPASTFSLTKLLNRSNGDEDDRDPDYRFEPIKKNGKSFVNDPFKYESSSEEDETEEKEKSTTSDVQGKASLNRRNIASSKQSQRRDEDTFFLHNRTTDFYQDIFFKPDLAEKAVMDWKERRKILVEVLGKRRRYVVKKLKQEKADFATRQRIQRIKKFKNTKNSAKPGKDKKAPKVLKVCN